VIIVLLAAGLVMGGLFVVKHLPKKTVQPASIRTPAQYTMKGNSLEQRLYPGDTILVTEGDKTYKLGLTAIGDAVTVTAPSGELKFDLGQEAKLDLDGDGTQELSVTVADFEKNNGDAGALFHFEMAGGDAAQAAASGTAQAVASVKNLNNATVIFTSPNPYPFTIEASFQGYCMFRWEILFEKDKQGRNEQYYQRTDSLTIRAKNGVRLWISNAQAVKLTAIGDGGRRVPLELGAAGEVIVDDIRWANDAEGRYSLVITSLD
jgi:hypothetical protein